MKRPQSFKLNTAKLMAKRMINSEMLEDKDYVSLSDKGRLLWIGLIINADVLGRGRGDNQSLKNKTFPQNHISLAKVAKIRQEVRKKMKNVKFYQVKGEEFYQLLNWEKYQFVRKDRPRMSNHPQPSGKPMTNQGTSAVGLEEKRIEENRIEENRIKTSSKKPYYKPTGEQMRLSRGKWWVLPKEGGQWLEFAGNIKEDIVYK